MKNIYIKFLELYKKKDLSSLFPYLGILIVLVPTLTIHISGDTQALLTGVNEAVNCLSKKPITFPCGPGVIHFPIFQYIVSSPFNFIGVSNELIIKILGLMSFVWFFIAGAVFWRVGFISVGKSGAHLSLLILLSGYMLWYMSSSFNEAASFGLFSLLVLSILDKWKLLKVCFIAFACTITKEVAFPFVLYFMLISFFARESRIGINKTFYYYILKFFNTYIFAILSIMAGVAINFAFNYFRYGSIKNLFNLDPALHTPLEYIPNFLLFLFFSPAAGLVFTWFSLSTILILPIVLFVRNRLNIILILLTLLGLILANIGFASWYSPFGFNAWGPRLTLPFLGSVAIISIYLVVPDTIIFLKKLGQIKGLLLCFTIITISSLPNLAVRLDGNIFFTQMFEKTRVEINSGIQSFTIQSSPKILYMESSIEGYSRNIIIPTTIKVALKNWIIILVWLFSLFFICRRVLLPLKLTNNELNLNTIDSYNLISFSFKLKQKKVRIELKNNIALTLVAALFLSTIALYTRTNRDYCASCFDLWQKIKLGEAAAEYHLMAPENILVKNLDNFPSNVQLAKIQIKLPNLVVLDSISISAIDNNGNDLGNWVTRPISYLWGIGILNVNQSNGEVINNGLRKDNLKLPIRREILLLIPDNGNLSKNPKLYIRLNLESGKSISTLAFHKNYYY